MTPVVPLVGPLVGRRTELAELRRRLPSERLLTLTGAPGCGTSVLAAAAAVEYSRAHPEPVRTVAVSDLEDNRQLVAAVGTALEVAVESADASVSEVAASLRDRSALLLLDGCERLVDVCAELVNLLLKEAPGIRVLVTSRQVLGIPGEVVVRIGPLGLPDERGQRAEQAASSDAVALFVERATEARRSFRLTDDNAPSVSAICELLEGNALAIVLAAARVSVLSPEDLLPRLEDRFRVLTKAAPEAPERQRSLTASMQTSYDLCTADEQKLWTRLAVFAGSLDLEGAEQVCGGDGLHEADMLDLVDSLLEKGIVSRDESDPAQVRYRMPEMLRSFASPLQTEEQVRGLRDRHLVWCRAFVSRTQEAWFGARQVELCRRLRDEWPNVRAALVHAERVGAHDPVAAESMVDVAAGLAAFWLVTGDPGEGRAWLDRALVRPVPDDLQLRGVIMATWLAVFQGNATQARVRLEEARHLAGDPGRGLAVLDRLDGALAAREGRFDDAEALLRRAIEASVVDGDDQAAATGWYLLGCCHWMAGRRGPAADAAMEARALTAAVHETHLRSRVLALLAVAALDGGDHEAADTLARRALRMHASLGDQGSVTATVDLLAWVAAAGGDGERAAALVGVVDGRLRRHRRPLDTVPVLDATARRARVEEWASTALGRRRFAARVREGREMADDAGRAFALGDIVSEPDQASAEAEHLTPRELDVAELVGRGLSNRDIGTELGISERTAQGHVQSILRKLGFTSRTQVAAWVAERNARASG